MTFFGNAVSLTARTIAVRQKKFKHAYIVTKNLISYSPCKKAVKNTIFAL